MTKHDSVNVTCKFHDFTAEVLQVEPDLMATTSNNV